MKLYVEEQNKPNGKMWRWNCDCGQRGSWLPNSFQHADIAALNHFMNAHQAKQDMQLSQVLCPGVVDIPDVPPVLFAS